MTSQLSRQGRLPTWNRPGLCRKSGADVRKLARDQSTPISLQSSAKDQATSKELSRVVQLEKNVLFLKQQHQETLEQLHREVEKLRSENRGGYLFLFAYQSKVSSISNQTINNFNSTCFG